MLVPLLHIVGFAEDQQATSVITRLTEQLFNAINLPLTLTNVLILYITLIIFRSLLLYQRETVLNDIQLGFVDHMRVKLYDAIGRANWIFLSKKRTSDLTHVLTTDINRIAQGTHFILQILVSSFIVLAYIIVAFKLSATMTLIALSAGVLLMLIPQVRKARTLGNKLSQANREVFATVADFLDGIKLAKSYAAEARYSQSFNDALFNMRSQQLAFTRNNSFAQKMYQIGAAIALSILLYIAVVILVLPVAELIVLVLIFSRLLPLISQLQSSYLHIMHILPAFTSAMHIQKECEQEAEIITNLGNWQPSLVNNITLNNIEFRFNKQQQTLILDDLSLTLPARQTLGIAGASGAGKSTLADIYAGLIAPDKGVITIDNHQLLPEDHYQWRQSVAYVPQETFLFHDSIRNNLLWANAEATEKDLTAVLKMAAADEFVSKLPEGMDTIIGDRGIRLSGGERQRIALARALLAKPLLLIMDEATSALDTENERHIQQAIDNLHGELTIIIIAHRLSTIRQADQIIVIENGKLTEQGRGKY
jgi:ATP-binding cassette subfamily C protein